jgi:DNA-binding SARP family transcriptional activator
MLRLSTLGTFTLEDERGQPLDSLLAQPKRAALLVFLAVARPFGFHRRDALLALLWPEMEASRARHALRQALHTLRAGLGPDVIVCRGSSDVGIREGRMRCDARELDRAAARSDRARVTALFRGDLLPGFHLSGAPGFERWLEEERERVRRLVGRMLWQSAQSEEEAGEMELAVEHARAAVRLSPYDEVALRRLLSLLGRAGDRAAALRFYRDFAEELAREFDTEPSPETVSLVEALRGSGPGAESPRAVRPPLA